VVNSVLELLQPQVQTRGLQLVRRYARDLPPVALDRSQFVQAIQNLVLNAIQALGRGGAITVATEATPDGVAVSVADNGPGIPESVMPHIFDPFYSTKGEGRGLGLAIAHSIVQKHDGSILVESRVGSGTTFTLKLPSDGTTIERPIEKTAAPQTGTGRVLWMDDEPGVLEVGGEILSILGYEVECARDGEEAIVAYRKAKEAGRPFDLVILDLTVPGAMGGEDAIKRLKAFDPGAKAVVCSGYSNSPITSDFREHGFEGVLQKPFNVNELSALAKQMVDVHSRRSP